MDDPINEVSPHEIALPVAAWVKYAFAATGAIAAALLVHTAWAVPAYATWGALLGIITAIDLRELRIPNRLVAVTTVVTFPLLALALLADIEEASLLRALLGAIAAFVIYLVLNIISPSSLGMGDVKLSFAIGAHLGFFGWMPWLWGIFFAFLLMALVGVVLMVFSKAGLKTALPFGPFMVLGAFVALAIPA